MPFSEGLFSQEQGFTPVGMWAVLTRKDGDEIPDGSAKNAHGRGQFGVRVRCVPVLEDGALKWVDVDIAVGGGVGHEESFDGFNS